MSDVAIRSPWCLVAIAMAVLFLFALLLDVELWLRAAESDARAGDASRYWLRCREELMRNHIRTTCVDNPIAPGCRQ